MRRFSFPKMKFEKKLMLSFIVLVFVPVLIFCSIISVTVWNNDVKLLRQESSQLFRDNLQTLSRLNRSIEHKALFLSGIINNMVLLNMDKSYSTVEYMSEYSVLKKIMGALIADDVHLYSTVYVNNPYLTESEYIKKSSSIDPSLYEKIKNSDNSSFFWCIRSFEDNGVNRKYISMFLKQEITEERVIIFEVRYLLDYALGLLNESCDENSFVVYKNGDVSICTNKNVTELTGNGLDDNLPENINKSKYFVTYDSVVEGDSVALYQEKLPIYLRCITTILWLALAVVFVLLLIFLMLHYVSNKLAKRLNNITNRINVDIKQLVDNVIVTKDEEKDDEFSLINNKMAELIKELRDYYKKLSEYEVEILQGSINPHLLYNTLASIRSISNSKKLNSIIDDMVQYYRIVLNNGNKYLTVRQEMTLLDKYIQLQKFAHDYKFDFVQDIPEELYSCKILKNLLQPIVENALFHGINSMDSGGKIEISARRIGEKLIFTISDNGEGMSEETLKSVREFTLNKVIGGYGIKNIVKRIKALYGNDYGITIDSQEGRGTVVTVSVPYDIDNENEGK